MWREHYLKQRAHNQQLEAQLKQLERKLADLKSEIQNGQKKHIDIYISRADLTIIHFSMISILLTVTEQEAGTTYEGLSEVNMRQLLRRLVKEKAELEWQLRDCEWRLDQESTVSVTELSVNLDGYL